MVIGGNNPPSQIAFTQETTGALSEWLKDNPVVQTEDQAREGKLLVDRARLCVADLESERDSKVRPLNTQVRVINDEYRGPRETLQKISQELLIRLDAYRKAEEQRREQEAEEKRKLAEEAERRAREAEAREQEAQDDARLGVEVDIGSATVDADRAFRDYEKADREAARAEKETRFKLGGGFSRSLSTRSHETITVSDPLKALAEIGYTEKILEAIVSEAREFRRKHDRLPQGIKSVKERRL